MYTMHQLETPSAKTVVEKICSANTLEPEGNLMHTQDPQRRNMLQNMYSAWNAIWRNVSKVPSTFLRNRNNPLSVTLVQNEGIISPEFFKHLTRREEPLTTDNTHVDKVLMKKALDIEENLHGSTFHGSHIDYAMERFNIFKKIKDPECMERFEELVKFGKFDRFDTVDMSDYIVNRHEAKLTKTTELDVLAVYYYGEDQIDRSSNKIDTTKYTEKSADIKGNMIPEEKKPSGNTGKLNIDKEPSMRPVPKSEKAKESSLCRTGGFLSTFQRRQKGLANSKATAGRSFSERKKLDAVVNLRGQDRVERTKDRMERGKHNNPDDVAEHRCSSWHIDSNDFSDNDEECLMDTELFSNDKAMNSATCTINLVSPFCQRTETKSVVDLADTPKFLTRARFVPGPFSDQHSIRNGYSDMKCYPEIDTFRSRLSSESSLDSEDSYCIVFETGLEESSKASLSIEDDVEIEEDEEVEEEEEEEEEEDDDEDEDEDDDEDEDENEEVDESQSDIELSASKVRFNLMPKVHVMVQWDYAYRAARRGPWEEMARDRVRFKGRINSIDRVLSPILSAQHRTRIWQERFAT